MFRIDDTNVHHIFGVRNHRSVKADNQKDYNLKKQIINGLFFNDGKASKRTKRLLTNVWW